MIDIINVLKKFCFKYTNPEIMSLVRFYYRNSSLFSYEKGRIFYRSYITQNTVQGISVLVIAPHADDEIVGMGGALHNYFAINSKISVLYLTDGRYDSPHIGMSPSEIIKIRRKEAESLGEKYSFNQIFWDKEDSLLVNDNKTIQEMIDVLNYTKPDTVYLPSFFEFHYDHFLSNAIFYEAIKKTTNAANKRITLIGYEVHDDIPFPNFILDISSCFEQKLKMLNYYTTPLKEYDYIKLCRYRNELRFLKYINPKIPGYAEAYFRLSVDLYVELFENYASELKRFGSYLLRNFKNNKK